MTKQQRKQTSRFFQSLSANQIKTVLAITALVIVGIVFGYTQLLVNQIKERDEKNIAIYAEVLKSITSGEKSSEEYTFFLDQITTTFDFPLVITDANDEPIYPYKSNSVNANINVLQSQEEQRKYLKSLIEEMRQVYEPIVIAHQGTVLTKVYYTNSQIVTRLRVLPVIELIVVSLFGFMGYLGFSYIRNTEQSHVWVGLAKEAAHQLGTPLSSLLAWIEIMRLNSDDERQVLETLDEMQHDVDRLNKISQRFSKIGSKPELTHLNISELIERVVIYFEHRLPHLGKRVDITRMLEKNIYANVNGELFEWVIENLIKNAAESIEHGEGKIEITLQSVNNNVEILVQDNGKGMSPSVRRKAFRPGFSTKKRGWGLGLSLCKRIIEEYHQGKIYIKDSGFGRGTLFAIELGFSDKKDL